MKTNYSLETCVADEVLAEAARIGMKHKDIQAAAGMNPRTWGRYFVQRTRAVPLDDLTKVCAALGVSTSEILRRAEDRLAELVAPAGTLSEHITRQLSPAAQDAVRLAAAQVAERTRRGQPNG